MNDEQQAKIASRAVEHHQSVLERKEAHATYISAYDDFEDEHAGGERVKCGHPLFDAMTKATAPQYAAYDRARNNERNAKRRLERAIESRNKDGRS